MNKHDTEKEPLAEKRETTGAYLCIALSGFILLWLAAMQILSVFDALVIFGIIICASMGSIRGGIKEFFSFFGVLASFLIAINAYAVFYRMSGFDFWTGKPLWGKLGWFLLLLGSGWIVCRLLAYYTEKSVANISFLQYLNRVLGGTLGGLKGLIVGYVFIIVVMGTKVTNQTENLGRQFQYSFAHHCVQSLEDRYHFLKNLEKLQLSEQMNKVLGKMYKYFNVAEKK